MNRNFRTTVLRFTAFILTLIPVLAWADPAAFQVRRSGQGAPMIFIPGLASSGEVWDTTARHFAPRFECHVLTLAGFAGVAPVKEPLLTATEGALVDYMKRNHLQKPVIVGHSLGGVLALRLAADHPDLVGRLVIVDALPALGATQNPAATPEQLEQAAQQVRAAMLASDAEGYAAGQRRAIASMVTSPADADRIAAWGRDSDRTTVANAMADVLRLDLRQEIAKIHVPALVLGTWIAYKDFAPRAAIEGTFQAQYQKLAGVKIEMTDTARHFIMMDDSAWLLARMDDFLKE